MAEQQPSPATAEKTAERVLHMKTVLLPLNHITAFLLVAFDSVLFEGEFQALLKSRLSSVGTGACKPLLPSALQSTGSSSLSASTADEF